MNLSNLQWTDAAPFVVLALYFLVMRFVLPKLGVST